MRERERGGDERGERRGGKWNKGEILGRRKKKQKSEKRGEREEREEGRRKQSGRGA